MRIILLSDIHGNEIALKAVLDDVHSLKPDLYLVVGDIVDGHAPAKSLEMVAQLPNVKCILGNTDRYVITGIGPPELAAANVQQRPELLPKFQQTTASFAWTKGSLTATGWYDYLAALPLNERIACPMDAPCWLNTPPRAVQMDRGSRHLPPMQSWPNC